MANASRRERLRAAQEAQRRSRRARVIAAIGVAVGAVAAIAVMIWLSVGNAPSQPTANRPPNATANGDGIAVNPGKAKPGAPVVGLYLDYLCSHCVQFEEKYGFTLNQLANDGDIELINHTKVFLDRGDAAGLSHRAAVAAACSDVAGVYKAYHQNIFAAAFNGQYTDQLLRVTLPQQTGITGAALTEFQSCYDNRSMLGFVQGVEEASAKAGVTATPTMKVNGKTIDLATLPDDVNQLRQFIADAAKAQ